MNIIMNTDDVFYDDFLWWLFLEHFYFYDDYYDEYYSDFFNIMNYYDEYFRAVMMIFILN